MKYLLPAYSVGTLPLERVLNAIITFDQFDDWIPDPIYYQDYSSAVEGLASQLRAQWSAGSLDASPASSIALPRSGSPPLSGRTLPLLLRAATQVAAMRVAASVSSALPRDRVYGFRLLAKGERVFDPPGGELRNLFHLLRRAGKDGGDPIVIDVQGFNSHIDAARLGVLLTSFGAKPDEVNFLLSIGSLGPTGVASIDDAYACVYNFYLSPVDQRLMQEKIHFFRYRDEYFVFSVAARDAVLSALQGIGLVARAPRSFSIEIPPLVSKGESGEVPLLRTPKGVLYGELECKREEWDECSDKFEIRYREIDLDITEYFARDPEAMIDAVELTPTLRRVHEIRRFFALSAPPFANAPTSTLSYRKVVASGRLWLSRALHASQARADWWSVSWQARMLSDVGELSETEAAQLAQILRSTNAAATARESCRVALARSARTVPVDLLTNADLTSEYGQRSFLVAARLCVRSAPRHWRAATAMIEGRQKSLARYLELALP